jgi:hypothetical protein
MEIEGTQIVAGQFSALLDPQTCDLCMELDGQVFDMNNGDALELSPPLHFNCRCVIAYIGEDEMPSDKIPDFKLPSPDLIDSYATLKDIRIPDMITTPEGREIVKPVIARTPEAPKMTQEEWVASLSKEEKEAFSYWGSSSYQYIRKYQELGTLGDKETLKVVKKLSNNLDIALAKAPAYKGTVYRGLGFNNEIYQKIIKGFKVDKISWKNISSSSTERAIAEHSIELKNAERGILLEIENKSGVYIGIKGIAPLYLEKEVILMKNIQYKIISFTETKMKVYGKEIPMTIIKMREL